MGTTALMTAAQSGEMRTAEPEDFQLVDTRFEICSGI